MAKTIDPAEADIDELRVFAAAVAEETVDLSRRTRQPART
jgi:hypothetical protein